MLDLWHEKKVFNVMFILSHNQQNRNFAAFVYQTRKNIKIIGVELKRQQQQK
jgi:hypothetical protein